MSDVKMLQVSSWFQSKNRFTSRRVDLFAELGWGARIYPLCEDGIRGLGYLTGESDGDACNLIRKHIWRRSCTDPYCLRRTMTDTARLGERRVQRNIYLGRIRQDHPAMSPC